MTNTETQEVTFSSIREAMSVKLPAGKLNDVEIRPITITEEEAKFSRMRAAFQGGRGYATAGTITGLYRRGGLWMSDSPDEKRDHTDFVWACHQRQAETVLVAGLGLGMVISALRILPSVRQVTVVEIDADVVDLVGPQLQAQYAEVGKTLEVVHGDAMDPANTLPKGQRWDAAWMDIWQDLCTDNLAEMTTMARRYARRVGFQDYWSRDFLRDRRRREQAQERAWRW